MSANLFRTSSLAVLGLFLLICTAGPERADGQEGPVPRAYLPLIARSPQAGPPLLLSALYYDTYLAGEPDEAFQVYNPLAWEVALSGWQVTDGRRTIIFPPGLSLGGHDKLWCARQAISFTFTFGFAPACEYGGDSDPAVPDAAGSALQFGNTGGRVSLLSPGGIYSDTLVYEAGDSSRGSWIGPPVEPFRPSSAFSAEGQILYRKLDQRTGRPVADTDARRDWAQDPDDVLNGRKAQYPGWDLEHFFLPQVVTATASLQVIVAPDHAFAAFADLLGSAQRSIWFEGYTLEHARLGEILAERASSGVEVRILLDGSPPGGVSHQQRWVVQQVVRNGGRVFYLRAQSGAGIRKRYVHQHGKFWLLDDRLALIGSENPNAAAFPDDPKADGTFGRRGVYLATDAAAVVAALRAIMDADIDPAHHTDVWAWDASDPTLGAPPPDFIPSRDTGGSFYPVQKPAPLVLSGTFTFQTISSPEQALRDSDSLLGLIGRAGAGDTILVEQLYEHTYWGALASSAIADPNPRLEAYIAAARRGAVVRVLLDAYLDDLSSPRSNLRTVEYLAAIAQAEGLDLQARRRNPTGQGIHNKMILAEIGGQGWVVVGSHNGGEVSAKLNRELTLQVASTAAYAYLADIFWYDWNVTP